MCITRNLRDLTFGFANQPPASSSDLKKENKKQQHTTVQKYATVPTTKLREDQVLVGTLIPVGCPTTLLSRHKP